MEQEETSNPEGSIKVEEAAGEEPSTAGIKLFTLADKAEAFIRPACLSPLPNSTRRQLVERFGKPSLPCTSAPYLDNVLRPRLPAPVRARDNTVTPFLYHLVQGTLQYTHVNRILLYARTSLIRFCSEYVSLFL